MDRSRQACKHPLAGTHVQTGTYSNHADTEFLLDEEGHTCLYIPHRDPWEQMGHIYRCQHLCALQDHALTLIQRGSPMYYYTLPLPDSSTQQ